MNGKGRMIVSLLGLTLLGCASANTVAPAKGKHAPAKACFDVRDVLSFEALHDKFVSVCCRHGRHYLLTMENICLGLRNSVAIAVANDFNRVCSHDGPG